MNDFQHARWSKRSRVTTMDLIVDIGKALIAVVGILLVLIVIPFLFMTIFSIATGIDERMNR